MVLNCSSLLLQEDDCQLLLWGVGGGGAVRLVSRAAAGEATEDVAWTFPGAH